MLQPHVFYKMQGHPQSVHGFCRLGTYKAYKMVPGICIFYKGKGSSFYRGYSGVFQLVWSIYQHLASLKGKCRYTVH